jgi:hypothetical protein
MEYLSKLFGSPAKVKLLRLFVFNPDTIYDRDAVVQASRITPDTASRELAALARAEVIKRKTYYKDVTRPGSNKERKRKTLGWRLDEEYPHLEALELFLRSTLTISEKEVKKRLRGTGTVRLVVFAGILIGEPDGAVDVLLVGDRLKEASLKQFVRLLEAESGKELRYMVLTTDDYLYRRRVRDKFVRDVMDFPHRLVIDKLSRE